MSRFDSMSAKQYRVATMSMIATRSIALANNIKLRPQNHAKVMSLQVIAVIHGAID